MPDSDDLLIDNSLSILLEKALESKADLVVADFLEMTDEEIKCLDNVAQKYLKVKEKTGEQMFLEDLNPRQCYVWRTLYRRAFIQENNLTFIPGVCYQDVPFTHECYLCWYLEAKANRGVVTCSFAETWRMMRLLRSHY